ncbi:MAG TPA: HK97-gp10 family putative phage morphogenesis protein [Buttiauxella sp.]|nr:HK97-gp10 family putative phage morphogenesis protein [Buttiauxella sp.]
MINATLDFSGLLDLSADLELLSKAENRKVMRDATREGATIMRDEVESRAPKLTGKLARNVVVITQRDGDGGISSGVHIRGQGPAVGQSDSKMKTSSKRNAYYWRFQELGTSKTPAVPFVRPSFDATVDVATGAAYRRANQAIDEVLSK